MNSKQDALMGFMESLDVVALGCNISKCIQYGTQHRQHMDSVCVCVCGFYMSKLM